MTTNAHPDQRAAELAVRQHGVIDLEQLYTCGFTKTMLRTRLQQGRLLRMNRGVYRLPGTRLAFEADLLGAILTVRRATDLHAVGSHTSAMTHWDLGDPGQELEVTVLGSNRSRAPGIVVHRTRRMIDHDWEIHHGIPVTSPARTIIDMSSRLSAQELAEIIDAAWRLRLVSPTWVRKVLEHLPLAPGRAPRKMARVLDDRILAGGALSAGLEQRVWDLIRRSGLPLPVAQYAIDLPSGPRRLDYAWPDAMVCLECDGFRFHSDRGRFDDDRIRRNELETLGWRVFHATHTMTDEQILKPLFGQLGALCAPN